MHIYMVLSSLLFILVIISFFIGSSSSDIPPPPSCKGFVENGKCVSLRSERAKPAISSLSTNPPK